MTPSIADIAYAMLIISHLRIDVQHEGIFAFATEIPLDGTKATAVKLINNASDEQLALGKWLIQFKYTQLPSAQRLKIRKRFYEHLRKADTPLHALQKAIEQVTANPIAVLATENQFS